MSLSLNELSYKVIGLAIDAFLSFLNNQQTKNINYGFLKLTDLCGSLCMPL
jgi:hypothetical protein